VVVGIMDVLGWEVDQKTDVLARNVQNQEVGVLHVPHGLCELDPLNPAADIDNFTALER
jgi:hypothetical protein